MLTYADGSQAHFSPNGHNAPTKFSPLFSPGALLLHMGVSSVVAVCYLPSRAQTSSAVSAKYTVIARAPPPQSEPAAGAALAGDGGSVAVKLYIYMYNIYIHIYMYVCIYVCMHACM